MQDAHEEDNKERSYSMERLHPRHLMVFRGNAEELSQPFDEGAQKHHNKNKYQPPYQESLPLICEFFSKKIDTCLINDKKTGRAGAGQQSQPQSRQLPQSLPQTLSNGFLT
jgi:hypothetical protein